MFIVVFGGFTNWIRLLLYNNIRDWIIEMFDNIIFIDKNYFYIMIYIILANI